MGATIGGAYAAIYVLMRRKITSLGPQIRNENKGRYRAAAEALGGIKPIKVAGCEAVFAERVARHSQGYAWSMAQVQIYSTLPRYLVESIGIALIVLLTLVLSNAGENFQTAVPLVTVYAFAGYKLMPALLTVFRHLTTIKAGLPMADALRQDLSDEPVGSLVGSAAYGDGTRMPFNGTIELVDVRFAYGRGDAVALDGINLKIRKNETVAFVGSTGCGKTTLIDSILGLLSVSGEIRVDGQIIDDANRKAWQNAIGYVPQDIFLIDDTVAKNIAFGVPEAEIDRSAVVNAARVADLHDFVEDELPNGYDTVVGERGIRFSGGQRQRIGIARALYHDPDVLILDEATSSLDTITERIVMQAVRDLMGDKTILMIAHRISTVVDADRIFLMDRGRIVVEGTYDSLMDRSERFKSLAGVFHGEAADSANLGRADGR
jgi:ABC-type multidrug transport system fused ATPase/permease subunit